MEPTAGAETSERELVDGARLLHQDRRIRAYWFGDQVATEVVI
jgi:hypothetical protein